MEKTKEEYQREMEEQARAAFENALKILSAILDSNNGQVAVSKEVFIKAEVPVNINAIVEGDMVVIKKIKQEDLPAGPRFIAKGVN